MRIKVVGTGRAVPAERVTTRALEATLGLGEGTLETVTGVVERYVCNAESQIDLACAAATLALADAGIEPGAVDLIVGGCGVPYQPLPATSPLAGSILPANSDKVGFRPLSTMPILTFLPLAPAL